MDISLNYSPIEHKSEPPNRESYVIHNKNEGKVSNARLQ
jgi:hypothetical protein